jgi:hypothetical protein
MAETTPAPASPEILFCTVHPTVQTALRCNKCGRPMCIKCARRTPVGYRCKECVSNQQAIFFNSQPLDPVIQLVVSGILSAVAAGLIGLLGSALGIFLIFLITIPASAFAGGLIADMAHRAAGRRHGRYSWLAVGAGIVIGALVVGAVPFVLNLILALQIESVPQTSNAYGAGGYLLGAMFRSIGWWVYVVVATGSGVGRLRMGK